MKYNFIEHDLFYKYVLDNSQSDFYVIVVGYEKCNPKKNPIGPLVRSHFVLHYCLEGKGYFTIDGKKYIIQKNDIFFIPVDTKISYVQDEENPWSYLWIEVNGSSALNIFSRAGFTKETPVYHDQNQTLKKLFCNLLDEMDAPANDILAIAKVFEMLHILIQKKEKNKRVEEKSPRNVVKRVCTYINENYNKSTISTASIAQHFFLNEAYLSRIFKEQTGLTITRYIYDIRMQKARLLLLSRKLNVQEVAYSVGFSDPLYFSKQFKKYSHLSPSKYKQKR